MSGALIALVALLAAAVLLYYLAPGLLFQWATALGRRAAGLKQREVMVDGHRVPYLDGGHGEVLLLLHGFAANKDHWSMIARLLTPHFRVIAPDLPGFGDASRVAGASYAVGPQLERIAAFARALGITEFHLGGNSMGGYLATLYALRHPQQVRSLWLLAPAGVLSAEYSDMLRMLEAGENPLIATDMRSFDRLAELCFCKQPYMPARFKLPLLARSIAEAPFNARIFEEMFNEPLALEERVAALAARTLVVWGDDDRVLHPSALDILRPLMPAAEFILMRDMGHVPMIERPAETALDFLRFHGRQA
ncbi:MAG: alpha/beta hydrolase [Proteobacteria bacterium]|nr:alpha/beta hydrolase [Pseudomonadota bacterium]